MDLRTSSKFRQTTTGAQLRRRREHVLGPGPGRTLAGAGAGAGRTLGGAGRTLGAEQRSSSRTFSRQLNHYQTQVTPLVSSRSGNEGPQSFHN